MSKKDHYLKIVEWSNEDQCYVGSIPGWIGKCCHGDNEEEVYHELCQIVEEWIEIYEEDNIPLPSSITSKKFSGKFQLRIDSDLHKALTIRAIQANESLNYFCGKVLKKTILQPDISRANNANSRAKINPRPWNWEKSHEID